MALTNNSAMPSTSRFTVRLIFLILFFLNSTMHITSYTPINAVAIRQPALFNWSPHISASAYITANTANAAPIHLYLISSSPSIPSRAVISRNIIRINMKRLR